MRTAICLFLMNFHLPRIKIENLTIVEEDVHSYEATKFTNEQNISPSELMARRQPLPDIQCVGPAAAVPHQLHTRRVFARSWEDTSLEDVPTRNVDYLSHEWVEEDIWTSWRYILARNDFRDKVRLENASWRTWAKLRCHLMTVSPDTLNWLVVPCHCHCIFSSAYASDR